MIDAVGMEAHGAPAGKLMQTMASFLPDALEAKLMERAGVDRLGALYAAIDIVRRGGTISLSGVYGGMADPLPMLQLFDKQVQLRMGQANVWRWIPTCCRSCQMATRLVPRGSRATTCRLPRRPRHTRSSRRRRTGSSRCCCSHERRSGSPTRLVTPAGVGVPHDDAGVDCSRWLLGSIVCVTP